MFVVFVSVSEIPAPNSKCRIGLGSWKWVCVCVCVCGCQNNRCVIGGHLAASVIVLCQSEWRVFTRHATHPGRGRGRVYFGGHVRPRVSDCGRCQPQSHSRAYYSRRDKQTDIYIRYIHSTLWEHRGEFVFRKYLPKYDTYENYCYQQNYSLFY